jgi:hypothetical protein
VSFVGIDEAVSWLVLVKDRMAGSMVEEIPGLEMNFQFIDIRSNIMTSDLSRKGRLLHIEECGGQSCDRWGLRLENAASLEALPRAGNLETDSGSRKLGRQMGEKGDNSWKSVIVVLLAASEKGHTL